MRLLLYLFFSLLAMTSCINDDFSVGDGLQPVKGRNVKYEECTVALETHLGDSSVTNGLKRIFEGKYISSDFGSISAHSYFDFRPPSYSRAEFGMDADVVVKFDSISLILKYDKFKYGDTTQVQNMNIYKVKQLIEYDDKYKLYSTSSFTTESEPWISKRFIRPNKDHENDSILEIRLPDDFGLELVDLMHKESDLLESYTKFQTYFKGIKLSPGENDNASVNSFVVNDKFPVIRIHYTTIGNETTKEKKMDLSINTSTAFSQIETDRSNTLLHSLNYSTPSIPSAKTENKIYLQGLTGLYNKLSFPDLNEILKFGDHVVISGAYLYVYPVLGTYSDFTPLPRELHLNYLNEEGKPIEIYVDPKTTQVQSGKLVKDDIYNKNTYYAFDITSYLQYELGKHGMYKSSLQLYLNETDKNNTLSSLVLGDADFKNEDNKIRLVLYITIYDND